MCTSDGEWLDYHPSQSGISTYYGIYEAPASVVPITMNLSVHASMNAEGIVDEHYGINTTSATASGAHGEISSTGEEWGGRIEAKLYYLGPKDYDYSPGSGSLVETVESSTITIGSTSSFPSGSPLMLHVDANGKFDSFSLKRGANTLLSLGSETETDLLVYAGETLNVSFSNYISATWLHMENCTINMYLVPEPGTYELLAAAFLALLAYARRRRK